MTIIATLYLVLPTEVPDMSAVLLGTAPVIAGSALAGAIAGTAQWMVLRRRFLRAGWWVLASALAWTASNTPIIVALSTMGGMIEAAPPSAPIGMAPPFMLLALALVPMVLVIPGLLVGVCTGYVLLRIPEKSSTSGLEEHVAEAQADEDGRNHRTTSTANPREAAITMDRDPNGRMLQ